MGCDIHVRTEVKVNGEWRKQIKELTEWWEWRYLLGNAWWALWFDN